MKIVDTKLKSELNLRTEKNFPKEGIEFIDINPLTLQSGTFNEIVDLFYEELKDKDIDYIVGPEARGFIFGSILAYKLKVGFIPVRKKGKLAPTTVEVSFEYEKEYGKDILELPKLVEDTYENKKFYIIDDIYATGNTVEGIKNSIEELGGNVNGIGVIINILELNDKEDLFSLIDIMEE